MSTTTGERSRTSVSALWVSLRPHQWIKNVLLFSGLVFSHSLPRPDAIVISLWAFVAFCMASSGIYIINDLRDLEADRMHSIKRLRPLAAGLVNPLATMVLSVLLLLGAATIGWLIRPAFLGVLTVYVGLNVLYSFGLKRVVILDVMILALGFVLRAVAGAVAIGVVASQWLILCTLTLALFVGFGKRRNELRILAEDAVTHRAVLDSYTLASLDLMMGISASAALVTYALYTVAPETVARVGSTRLVMTIPFVIFGIFRYLHLAHLHDEASDPARLFISDPPLLYNTLLWMLAVGLVIYTPWLAW